MEQIIKDVRTFDGILVLAPEKGDAAFPEIAWGDYFFYYAPDQRIPHNVQPFATIVTKNYPDDVQSDLDPDGRWRVNIHVGRAKLQELTDLRPGSMGPPDFTAVDVFLPHPVYGALGWVAVVNPGTRTTESVIGMLRDAHADQRRRLARRPRRHTGDGAVSNA